MGKNGLYITNFQVLSPVYWTLLYMFSLTIKDMLVNIYYVESHPWKKPIDYSVCHTLWTTVCMWNSIVVVVDDTPLVSPLTFIQSIHISQTFECVLNWRPQIHVFKTLHVAKQPIYTIFLDFLQGQTIPINHARPNRNLTYTKKEPIG